MNFRYNDQKNNGNSCIIEPDCNHDYNGKLDLHTTHVNISLTSENKKNWREIRKISKYSNEENLNLIGSFYNGNERIYLLFHSDDFLKIHLMVYSIPDENLILTTQVIELEKENKLSSKTSAEVFCALDKELYWYLLTGHSDNKIIVLKLDIEKSFSGTIIKDKDNNQVFKNFDFTNFNLIKTENATMKVILGFPFLAGGIIYGGNGYEPIGLCVNLKGIYPNSYSMPYLKYARDNPIVVALGDCIYYLGGNKNENEPFIEYNKIFLKSQELALGIDHLIVSTPNNFGNSINAIPHPVNNYLKIREMNATNTSECVLNSDIYLFPKTLFGIEKTFYRYQTLTNSWILCKIQTSNAIKLSAPKSIEKIKAIAVDDFIYIVICEKDTDKKIEIYKLNP